MSGRIKSWFSQSAFYVYLIGPLVRTAKVSLHLNSLLFRISPVVAIMLPLVVVGSSILLYVQGRLFARLIGAIYNDSGIEHAFLMFVLALLGGLFLNFLIKKFTTSERFHIREYFDPLVPIARNALGMKSFSYPHNEKLNQAEDGAYNIKFFAPQQVAFITQVMNLALGIGFMVFYAVDLLPYFLAPLVAILMIDLYLASRAAKIEEESWEIFSECTETKRSFTYPDRLKGVLLFGMADPLINHIKVKSAYAFKVLRLQNLRSSGIELVSIAAMWGLVYYIISQTLTYGAPLEIRIFLVTTVLSVTAASKRLIETFAEQLFGSERVEHVLEFERKDRAKARPVINEVTAVKLHPGDLEFKNMSVGYSPGKNIIENASAVIPAGSLVHVFGQNGSGKTTLFSVISGLYDLPAGMAFFGGVDLSTVPSRQRMGEFRQLTQDTVSFRSSFRETLGWAAGFMNAAECPEEWMWEALEMACLADKVRQAPEGLDQSLMISKVKKSGDGRSEQYSLSGGEMKRLNHAMFYIGLLHGAAKVAILDEPYNNIDPQISEKLRANVRRLPGIKLVATHDARHYIQDDDLVLYVEKQDEDGKVPRSCLYFDTHGNLLEMLKYRQYLGIDAVLA